MISSSLPPTLPGHFHSHRQCHNTGRVSHRFCTSTGYEVSRSFRADYTMVDIVVSTLIFGRDIQTGKYQSSPRPQICDCRQFQHHESDNTARQGYDFSATFTAVTAFTDVTSADVTDWCKGPIKAGHDTAFTAANVYRRIYRHVTRLRFSSRDTGGLRHRTADIRVTSIPAGRSHIAAPRHTFAVAFTIDQHCRVTSEGSPSYFSGIHNRAFVFDSCTAARMINARTGMTMAYRQMPFSAFFKYTASFRLLLPVSDSRPKVIRLIFRHCNIGTLRRRSSFLQWIECF